MREILVIDDDKLTRWSLARVLIRAGYRVQEASSASEGLTRVQDAAPDLVFLDCRLPDGDGTSVLQRLQEVRPRLPVVMISADATQETALSRETLCTRIGSRPRRHAPVVRGAPRRGGKRPVGCGDVGMRTGADHVATTFAEGLRDR
jgi:CheY-like chemotaxis protein